MAGVVDTTHTFATNEVITSTLMNNIIDETFFTNDALANGTLALTAGKIKVATSGITSNEIGANAVTANAILNGVITDDKISASAGIALSKLAVGALPTDITVTTANILDDSITTAKILNANVTAPKLNGAQTGSAPIYGARAWAKLNPYVGSIRTGAYKAGNYTTSSGTTTVTITAHGLKANDKIRLDFTSGGATDGLYTVVTADTNTFTISGAGGTSGAVTAQFVAIQGSGNISSASWYDANDDSIVLNFTTQMPNANYATCSIGQRYPGSWVSTSAEDTSGNTQLNSVYQCHVYTSQPVRFLNVVVFG